RETDPANFIEFERHGVGRHWAKCLFHKENTSSLCYLEDSKKCHCFGCGWHGNTIDLIMKHIVIAPVGDNLDALFIGIKEFPTEKIILICPKNNLKKAEKVKKDLKKFDIPVEIKEVTGNLMEDMFRIVAEIKDTEKENKIIVNIATGDKLSTCAALSAAFVNGIKAFSIMDGQIMLMPILKFSYYKSLTDKKLRILKLLNSKEVMSIEEISKKIGMSLPLIYYHINGTLKEEGLKGLELVETLDKSKVKLSMLGRLLIKGYIS
ncbi:MAG: ArsR family transcriptional regulator, partial [Nanoarchaeota archaeon]|nr:ArsR family transcriptional regulator [Nanoarchaeota archaeon]